MLKINNEREDEMKELTTLVALAGLCLSGCALPTLPDAATATPAGATLSLEGQSRTLRTKIVQLKQEVAVFEVMLTDVERRAAMSQISLSSLPNTEAMPSASVASDTAPNNADRLSVTVRPAPGAMLPPAENKNAKVPQN